MTADAMSLPSGGNWDRNAADLLMELPESWIRIASVNNALLGATIMYPIHDV
jgi:hypothetical protein